MNLDLRTPIGMMFTFTGLILSVFGYSTSSNVAAYAKTQGLNVNLWWGLVLLAFGMTLFLLSRRDKLRPAQSAADRGQRSADRDQGTANKGQGSANGKTKPRLPKSTSAKK